MRPALKPRKPEIERPKIERNPRLRQQVWNRDQGICAICGRYDAKWIHDHVNPLWRRGADTLENSQTLCRRHSTSKTSKEAGERAKADRLAARNEITKQRRSIPGATRP